MRVHKSEYFYGNKISDYGLENGYVDYRTLAKAFDGVLNNGIIENTMDTGYWEQVSGMIDNSDEIQELYNEIGSIQFDIDIEEYENEEELAEMEKKIEELENKIEELENEQYNSTEVFQYFIVDDNGAELLSEINEIVFYNEYLDMNVWGVTHYGTSWDYVLTDIKIELDEE